MPRLVNGQVVYDQTPAAAGSAPMGLTTRYDSDQTRRRVKMISHAYPALKKKPKLLASLANSEVEDDDLVQMVARSSGFAQIQSQARRLRRLDPDEQGATWNQLDKTQRSLLKNAGYQPSKRVENWEPEVDEGNFGDDLLAVGKGALGALVSPVTIPMQLGAAIAQHPIDLPDITDTWKGTGSIGTAIGRTGIVDLAYETADDAGLGSMSDAVRGTANAFHTVSDFAEQEVLAPAAHYANTVSTVAQHYYRAAQELDKIDPEQADDKFGLLSTGIFALLGSDEHMRHFEQAWETTSNGEQYFNTASVRIAEDLLAGNVNQLETARAFAGGRTPDEIAAKYGKPGEQEYTDTYLELIGLQGQPRFQKAVAALQDGKVSPGRDLARTLGVYDEPYVGDIVSGVGDGVFSWYTDPLLIAGKVRKAWKLKDVIRAGTAMEDIGLRYAENATVAEQIIPDLYSKGGVTPGDITKLTRKAPYLAQAEEIAMHFRNGADKTDPDAWWRFFHANRPRFLRSIPSLQKWDAELRAEKQMARVMEAAGEGRPWTLADHEAVKGIEDGRDIARYFSSQQGIEEVLRGTWGYSYRGGLLLPKRTMMGATYGKAREVASMHMDWYAAGDIHRLSKDVPLAVDDELLYAGLESQGTLSATDNVLHRGVRADEGQFTINADGSLTLHAQPSPGNDTDFVHFTRKEDSARNFSRGGIGGGERPDKAIVFTVADDATPAMGSDLRAVGDVTVPAGKWRATPTDEAAARASMAKSKAELERLRALSDEDLGEEWAKNLARDESDEYSGADVPSFNEPDIVVGERLARGREGIARGAQRVSLPYDPVEVLNKMAITPAKQRVARSRMLEKRLGALHDPAEGTTRLYQVRIGGHGPTDLGVVPDIAQREWTDSLELAQSAGIPLGQYGQLYYSDVADDALATWGVRYDEALAAQGANNYIANKALGGTHLGAVGDFATLNGRVISKAERVLFTPPARLIKMLTAKIPETKVLNLHGNELPEQLVRLLNMEYGGQAKAELFGQIMAAPNTAIRRQMIKSVVDRIAWSNGLYSTEEGAIEARKFVMGIDQKYAPNGRDIIHMGTKSSAEGTSLSHYADSIRIPDFRELMAVSKRIGVLNGTLNGINSTWVDAFTGSYWRPAMLLRLGFAPRGAADEFLTALLGAPEMYTRGAWLKLAKATGDPVTSYRDMSRMREVYLQYDLPGLEALKTGERTLEEHWTDRLGRIVFGRMHGTVGAFATRQLDPMVLKAARDFGQHPAVTASFFDEMTKLGVNATGAGLVDNMVEKGDWFSIVDRKGNEVRLSNVPGAHDEYTDALKPEVASHQGSTLVRDQVQGPMIAAGNLHVSEDRALKLQAVLAESGHEYTDAFDAVEAARYALVANPKFSEHYHTYLSWRGTPDQAIADEAFAKMIETAGDDPLLNALAMGADQLDNATSWMLRVNPRDTYEMLASPHTVYDEVQQAMYGPSLYTQPEEYTEGLFAALPAPEPGMTRVYGKYRTPQFEQADNVRAEARRRADNIAFEDDAWTEVSTDPELLRADLLTQGANANRNVSGDIDSLFYIDLNPTELIDTGLMDTTSAWLRNRLRGRAVRFGDDIGTQLDQMLAYSRKVDSIQYKQWDDLIKRAMRGDQAAADELEIEVGKRMLVHPRNAHTANGMTRSHVAVDANQQGTPVLKPAPDGVQHVYFLTFNPADTDTAFLHVDQSTSTGRKFVAMRNDPGPAEQMITDGDGTSLFPVSRWASTDPTEVEMMAAQIEERAAAAQSPITVGISRLDGDERYIRERFKDADLGSHDYQLRDGEGVGGHPIERNAKITRLEADEVTKTRDEIVKIHNDIRDQMRKDMRDTPAAPSDADVNDAVYNRLDFKDPDLRRFIGTKDQGELFAWVDGVKAGTIEVSDDGVQFANKIDAMRTTERDSLLAYPDRALVEEATNREVASILGSHPSPAEGEMQYLAGDVEPPVFDATHARIAEMHLKPEELEDMRRRWERYLPGQSGTEFARSWPGKHTIGNGATATEAQESFVQTMQTEIAKMYNLGGRRVHEISQRGLENGRVDVGWYVNSPEGVPLPASVVGPRKYVVEEKFINSLVRKGFDKFIAPLTNGIARTPRFYSNALKRYGETETILRPLLIDQEAAEAVAGFAQRVGLGSTDDFYEKLHGTWADIKANNIAAWEGNRTPKGVLRQVEGRVERGVLDPAWLRFSDDEWDTIHQFMRNEKLVRERVADVAADGALRDTIPFIDDSAVRSQFTDQVRNLSPFWWAQESFFRRWGRTIAHSPEAMRKAQLLVQGARHVGVIEKDENGRDVFMMPGLLEINEVIQKGAAFFGLDLPVVPIPVGVMGDVRLASPGFDQIGVPGMSPLVGVPLAAARTMFPENALVRDVEEGVMGERASGRNPLEQFFPAWLVQLGKASVFYDANDEQVTSAAISAMQYLEANGHGLKDDATSTERDDYFDQVRNYARLLMGIRAFTLFNSPVSPQYKIETGEIDEEFKKLLQNLPIEEATSVYLERHPNAHPYTVFSTQTKSGASIPGTEEALAFMDDNVDFIQANPLASSWMLPQSSATDKFQRKAYEMQKQLGLREQKTPDEWYTDFKYSQAAPEYFEARDDYERDRIGLRLPSSKRVLDDAWAEWKEGFFKMHPVFAEELQSRDGVKRREDTIAELDKVLADPKTPAFEHREQLVTILDAYHDFNNDMRALRGESGQKATEKRDRLRFVFWDWSKSYAASNPSVLGFYQRVIDPMIGLTTVEREGLIR